MFFPNLITPCKWLIFNMNFFACWKGIIASTRKTLHALPKACLFYLHSLSLIWGKHSRLWLMKALSFWFCDSSFHVTNIIQETFCNVKHVCKAPIWCKSTKITSNATLFAGLQRLGRACLDNVCTSHPLSRPSIYREKIFCFCWYSIIHTTFRNPLDPCIFHVQALLLQVWYARYQLPQKGLAKKDLESALNLILK